MSIAVSIGVLIGLLAWMPLLFLVRDALGAEDRRSK